MKTRFNNNGSQYSLCLGEQQRTSTGRWAAAAVSLLIIPSAFAGKADGSYEVVSAKGSIEYAGKSIKVPERLIERFLRVDNSHLTITDNRISLYRPGASRFAKRLGDEIGMDLTVRVSGPSSLKLVKQGNSFSGSTTEALVVSFEHDSFFDFKGTLKVQVNAELTDGNLTLTMPLDGKFLSKKIGGNIVVVCRR